ncbi:14 kDa phosphohistidine phosphatase-like [Asterias amurensis]|uniref:14 kDa phosphohistidine phosphatase-like n=1 Tax=Asterias amurensis TaxID=7602 RepID=UPI003AB7AA02
MRISSLNGSSLMLVFQTLLPKNTILHQSSHFTSKTLSKSLFSRNLYERRILLVSSNNSRGRRKMSVGNPLLDSVEDVDIDESGTFKYILVKVWPLDDEKTFKYIVRGYNLEYHADIQEQIKPKFNKMKIDCFCVGGGRIEHNPQDKSILVYGYSMGYGQANHSITVEKLKAKYPDYTSITFNNEGY